MVSSDHTQKSNTKHTEQVAFIYLFRHIQTITTKEKEVIILKESRRDIWEKLKGEKDVIIF